jgi:ABC-type Mn2+/Zn2+ transport system permease subunit
VGGSADTLHLLFGNILAAQPTSVVALTIIALLVVSMQLLFGRRFLLVTFDPEAATVAGVNTRQWAFLLNLATGVAAAAAVQAIGALSTFALLTLPAMAALLATQSVRATFAAAAILSIVLPTLALAASFYLDLPAGPASVALLAIGVPLAALTNGFGDGGWLRRRPAGRHPSPAPTRPAASTER